MGCIDVYSISDFVLVDALVVENVAELSLTVGNGSVFAGYELAVPPAAAVAAECAAD